MKRILMGLALVCGAFASACDDSTGSRKAGQDAESPSAPARDAEVVVPGADARAPAPDPDGAVALPADAATVVPFDAATVVPPDAAVAMPDSAVTVPDAAVITPPDAAADAAVITPPDPDAAVITPPDPDAFVPRDPDAAGDPCVPSPCIEPLRSVCVLDAVGAAQCVCDPGYHADAATGDCVLDDACTPARCSGHGACAEMDGSARCTCDPGFAGDTCAVCDAGFHPDGLGGCTADPCLPNPCVAPNQGRCVLLADAVQCACDAGFHLEGGDCRVDEVCTPATCGGHGACAVVEGRTQCTCAAGYDGPTCAACANGFHGDGAGGCADDPCRPDPCGEPGRGVCVALDAQARCDCDAGLHEDGQGECTADPCRPDPCLAQNLACRDAGGAAECYLPPCDDGNPCTVDRVENGQCRRDIEPEGTPCATSLCLVGEACAMGVCAGGLPRVCDDANACTADRCDEVAGCQSTNDDARVPDDGVACTVDTCRAGVAAHAATDARCDDALWCTGREVCTPAAVGADAAGCVHLEVPAPPVLPANPCARVGACDEATRGFPLVRRPAGAVCDDGLICTQNDACTEGGACVGVALAGCPGNACVGLGDGPLSDVLDVPLATVTGRVTLNGAALPNGSSVGASTTFMLVSHDTGAKQAIHSVRYGGCCGNYTLTEADRQYATRVVPGVYGLYVRRGYDSATNVANRAESTDESANGYRILRSDLVIGPGANLLDLDVQAVDVRGHITAGGAEVPAANNSGASMIFYAVSRDTGALHTLATVRYGGCCGNYTLTAADRDYASRLMPGRYDLWYRRSWSSADDVVLKTESTDTLINGMRVLREDVQVGPGPLVLNLDVPVAEVRGHVTAAGAEVPAMNNSGASMVFYAVATDTGAWHTLHTVRYGGCCGNYTLTAADRDYTGRLMPGTYDLLYRRSYSSADDTVLKTETTDTLVNGLRYLRRGVVVAPGLNTLDLDVPAAEVSGHVTIGGAEIAAMNVDSGSLQFYLVAQDTGARHTLHAVRYGGCCGNYTLTVADRDYRARIMPGRYDLWVRRSWSSADNVVSQTQAADNLVNGLRVLRQNVDLLPGANRLDLDVTATNVTGHITVGGAEIPPGNETSGSMLLYLVSQDTGAWHTLASVRYGGCCGNYTLTVADRDYRTRVMPGTYDLLYRRAYSAADGTSLQTDVTDALVNGLRYLRRDVVVAGANQVLDVDVPVVDVAGEVTFGGLPAPAAGTVGASATFYLVSEDTGAWHGLSSVTWGGCCGRYTLGENGAFARRFVPGVYDVLYRRGYSSATGDVNLGSATDELVNGLRVLNRCVSVESGP